MLLCLPYLGERWLYLFSGWEVCSSCLLRCLFLGVSSCLSYLRRSYFCHSFPLHSYVICSPYIQNCLLLSQGHYKGHHSAFHKFKERSYLAVHVLTIQAGLL
jgi:Fe-S-cluster containining protein